ncbi:MAG: hypothetical protein AB1648_02145 [Pseudomonadota bacterium]|jgi:hypothetical protein
MKATIDIPDDLYRQVKAKAALKGSKVKDVAIRLFEKWVSEADEEPPFGVNAPLPGGDEARRQAAEAWLKEWQAVGREVGEKSVDPRSTVEILLTDRR